MRAVRNFRFTTRLATAAVQWVARSPSRMTVTRRLMAGWC